MQNAYAVKITVTKIENFTQYFVIVIKNTLHYTLYLVPKRKFAKRNPKCIMNKLNKNIRHRFKAEITVKSERICTKICLVTQDWGNVILSTGFLEFVTGSK